MNRIKQLILQYWPLIIIVLTGAYLRLYKINEYLTFLGDEGRDVLIVKRMIVDGKWTLLGPTASVGGFYMGPVYYYFMLPFLWIWKLDPVGPAVMVAIFGIATIILIYKLSSEIFGRFVAVTTSALYAVSPLVIAYSRASWNPNIVPFFSVSLIYLTYLITSKRTWSYVFWAGLIFGIGIQLHYTFLFLFPVVAVWLLIHGHARKHIPWYLAGCLGFLIGFSPFLGFELRHEFANTRGIASFIFAGKDTGFSFLHFITNCTDVFFRLFARLLIRYPDAGTFEALSGQNKLLWSVVSWLTAVVSVGLSIAFMQDKKTSVKERSAVRLLLFCLATVLFFFGIYKKSIYDYYFGIFFIVPFLLTAIAANRIRLGGKTGRVISGIFVCGLILFNLQGRPFRFAPNNQLEQTKTVARAVLEKTDGKPYNFALITGGNSDHAYRYFLEIWGRPPVTIENPVIDPERRTVTDQLLVVCEYPDCEPVGNSLWEIAGFGRAEIAGSWDVSVLKVFKLVHYKGAD